MNETSIYHEVHLPRNERRIHMLPGFFGGDGARARSGAAGGVQGGDMIEEPAVLVVGWTTTVFDHVSRRHAGDQVKRAAAFLQWLSARGLTLASCRQPDIDAWYAENNEHARNYSRPFLQWCMNSKLTGRFRLPQAVIRHAAPLPDGPPCRQDRVRPAAARAGPDLRPDQRQDGHPEVLAAPLPHTAPGPAKCPSGRPSGADGLIVLCASIQGVSIVWSTPIGREAPGAFL